MVAQELKWQLENPFISKLFSCCGSGEASKCYFYGLLIFMATFKLKGNILVVTVTMCLHSVCWEEIVFESISPSA